MILTCPACDTRYSADPASLGPYGRTVRCAKCNQTWTQAPPVDMPRHLEVPPVSLTVADEEAPGSSVVFRFGGAALLIGVLLLIAVGGYFGRSWIVERWPALKPFYELAGIATESISAELRIENLVYTRPIPSDLVIQGNVVNHSKQTQTMPMLRAILANDNGKPLLQWDFSLDRPSLPPGGTLPFQTMIKNTPPGFKKLQIAFVPR
jgi:predicted Zn finger-like uncharacterized protein